MWCLSDIWLIQVNILVEDSGKALLCDFGLSWVKSDVTSRTAKMGTTVGTGSRNWMAPELLVGSPVKTPTDIYAVGMTIYEVMVFFTTDLPFC
jgi:serine/threonine protein kinase